jgi:hypothetical protein
LIGGNDEMAGSFARKVTSSELQFVMYPSISNSNFKMYKYLFLCLRRGHRAFGQSFGHSLFLNIQAFEQPSTK